MTNNTNNTNSTHNNITTIPTVPLHVADAIARLHRTNIRYEALLAAYRSTSRAQHELKFYAEQDDADNIAAADLVLKALDLAKRNGWDWQEIERMVREAKGYNENWRTPREQAMFDAVSHLA